MGNPRIDQWKFLIHFSNISLFQGITVWMRNIAPLLLQNQFYRTMIRAQHLVVDDHILNSRNQGFRDEEIVNAPAYTPLTGRKTIRPPRKLDAVRIKITVDVHKAMLKEILHPPTFLRHETGGLLILFWVFQINRHVSRVEVTDNDDVLASCMESLTQSQQMSIEVPFVVQAVLAALAIREVNIE